jgi:bifunctional non-homologous end joining protein LigD
VLGHDGLSRFEELSHREGARLLYAFDLIEHDGEDMRNRPFLDRKAALARLLRDTRPASCSTSTSPGTALSSSRTPAGLWRKGIVSKKVDSTCQRCGV